jgi:hypothetical protein
MFGLISIKEITRPIVKDQAAFLTRMSELASIFFEPCQIFTFATNNL